MRWSVGIEAEGERVFTREEVVELADAVAAHSGVATGIGTSRYGARLLVIADSREGAIGKAAELFRAAAQAAGLPAAPVVWTEAISEAEEALSEEALSEEALSEEAQAEEADADAVDASGPR